MRNWYGFGRFLFLPQITVVGILPIIMLAATEFNFDNTSWGLMIFITILGLMGVSIGSMACNYVYQNYYRIKKLEEIEKKYNDSIQLYQDEKDKLAKVICHLQIEFKE